ncbi:MAG: hypothetical protein ACOCUR_01120 [Nanoarchaeota archaeon]
MRNNKKEKDEEKRILEDLQELQRLENDDYEENQKSLERKEKTKKIAVISAAIIISLLVLSYVFLRYPTYQVILGQIESGSVKENILKTSKITVIFEEKTLQESVNAWRNNPDMETTLCLRGSRKNETFIVDNTYQPTIFSQGYFHVSHEPCDEDTVLMFHTHPYKRCIASETDIRTLRNAQERNQEIAMIIMCEESRFSVYR